MRRDRERDDDENAFLSENPIGARLVANASLLQRGQQCRANPDLFLRFEPASWRALERDVLQKLNSRERAESEARGALGERSIGAHRLLWTVLDEPGDRREHEAAERKRFRLTYRRAALAEQMGRWATGVLHALRPGPPRLLNLYVAQQVREAAAIVRHLPRAALLWEGFPYGRVDLEPNAAERDYLYAEQRLDERFASQAVRWFLSPNLARAVGHAHNPFRCFAPPARLAASYVWRSLPRARRELPALEREALTTVFADKRRVAHAARHGRLEGFVETVLRGNRKGQ